MSVRVGGKELGTLDAGYFSPLPKGGKVVGAGFNELMRIVGSGYMDIVFDLFEDDLPYANGCRITKVHKNFIQDPSGGAWGTQWLEFEVNR